MSSTSHTIRAGRAAIVALVAAAAAVTPALLAPGEGRADGAIAPQVDRAVPGAVTLDPGEKLRVSVVHYPGGDEIGFACNGSIVVYDGQGKQLARHDIDDLAPGASATFEFDAGIIAPDKPMQVYVVVRHVGNHLVGSTAEIIGPEKPADKSSAGAAPWSGYSPLVMRVASL